MLCVQVQYCSSICQDQAWKQYHRTLCLRSHSHNPNHPLEQLNEAWKWVFGYKNFTLRFSWFPSILPDKYIVCNHAAILCDAVDIVYCHCKNFMHRIHSLTPMCGYVIIIHFYNVVSATLVLIVGLVVTFGW